MEKETAEVINVLLMRHQVLGLAVRGLLKQLPDERKQACAQSLRTDVAGLMQDMSELLSPQVDEAITLELAQCLEALGFPPDH